MRYDPWVSIVSAGRPANVGPMTRHCRGLPDIHWYVPDGQADAYRAYGAGQVHEVDGPLVDQRNRALDDAHNAGKPCLQMDDDLQRIQVLEQPTDMRPMPASMAQAAEIMMTALAASEARLVGASSTDNAYFVRRAISRRHFIPSALMLVAPCPLRFDPQFRVKADYDYTAQHIAKYGEVARVDRILPKFLYRTNRGGCQVYRSPALDDEAVARLVAKWPAVFHPNPRRHGEVLMRWPSDTSAAQAAKQAP